MMKTAETIQVHIAIEPEFTIRMYNSDGRSCDYAHFIGTAREIVYEIALALSKRPRHSETEVNVESRKLTAASFHQGERL